MGDFRYKAFISYSWADAKWGKWIHHAIETYHPPKSLIGKDTPIGPVPRRLHPLFKDREEEAAGASIGAAVEAALAGSEFLIVVCSPNSAKSQWVNREIAWFKTHRDPDRILALIVDGEPGDPAQECFPRALTHEVEPDMTVSDRPLDTPLAADARESGDGKRMARLKIAAAMLGLGLDELVRRDDRRRLMRARAVTAASMTLAAVMGALTWMAIEARNEAEFQRNEADGLVEFMLTDLREKLEPVGRLDALEVVGGRAIDYYARQKLGDLDADALGRRARALLLVGEISNLRGDSDAALKAFEEAAATTGEQLSRDPDNPQRLFDHAQSVFWVGYVAYNRDELANAERQWREYKRLADRLIALDPDKPEWQMEGSYAETNMGALLRGLERHAEAEPFLQRSVERIETVAAGEPWDARRQIEIGNAINWLAMTKLALGKYAAAERLFRREVEGYDAVLARDPTNASARNRLSVGLQFLADTRIDLGDVPGALAAIDRSLEVNRELRAIEPDNMDYQETAVRGLLGRSRMLRLAERAGEAAARLPEAERMLGRMRAADPQNAFYARELSFSLAMARAQVAHARGEGASGLAHLAQAETILGPVKTADDRTDLAELLLLRGDVADRAGQREQAQRHWTRALDSLPNVESTMVTRFVLLHRLGQSAQMAELRAKMDERGLRHPSYLAIVR